MLAWLLVAVATAPVALLAARLARRSGSSWLRWRPRAVPWTGAEVVLVFFLVCFFWPQCVVELLGRGSVFRWIYGAGVPSPDAATKLEAWLKVRRGIWSLLLAFPIQVATIVWVLRGISGTRLYQLGLSRSRLASHLWIGWVGWLFTAPVILLANLAVSWLYARWVGTRPEDHFLTRLVQEHPLPIDWVLIVLSAVIFAPVIEEMLFRGVLQRWLESRPSASIGVTIAALGLAVLFRLDRLPAAVGRGDLGDLGIELAPAGFALLLLLGFPLAQRIGRRWLPRASAASAIYASSAIFALFHANVWPSPIPLLCLALVLGFLAYRTQSLVPSITLHALFNGVACVMLLFTHGELGTEAEKGRAETSARRGPASVSTSIHVPGTRLPLRK